MAIEPAATEGHGQEVQTHARDYSRFLKMFRLGAIISFIIAMMVMLVISN